MPAIEDIGANPQELSRTLRDVVALSMVPAIWIKYDAKQIAESVAEVLVRVLGLDFVLVALRWGDGQPVCYAGSTANGHRSEQIAAIRKALVSYLDQLPPVDPVCIANPIGDGQVRVTFDRVAVGDNAMIAAASHHSEFPTPAQRLILRVAANQTAIAIRRWQAETALQGLNETLEQRVAAEIKERMKVEEAFRHAQKMEAMGRLTGGVAHDFNNLLAAVLANLEMLRKHLAGDAKARRLVDGAVEGAERGASLTQRLLAFARQQDLKPAMVDVGERVRGMIEIMRRSLGPMIEMETDIPDDLWPARVDANQFELAVLNLAVNARDAMPNGGRLKFSVRNERSNRAIEGLAAGEYVSLAVSDTGTGMDEDTLARATDPFFTTKGVGKGTGLGLSMVHGLAAQSGGALLLSSRLGCGTTAQIWLPRARGEPLSPPAGSVAAALPLISLRIMLVEDDALIAMATADMLTDMGHDVIEAPSAAAALDLLRSGTAVDLILTDQAMPGMTGTELAAEVRVAWPDLPMILVTGYAEVPENLSQQLPRLGKPFGQRDLAAAIAGVLPAQTAAITEPVPPRDNGVSAPPPAPGCYSRGSPSNHRSNSREGS